MKSNQPPVYDCVSSASFPELAHLFAQSSGRTVTEVHMHHTFIPTHADFFAAAVRHSGDVRAAGLELCQGMWKFHVFDRDFADIAQHVSIDPDGCIWLNRNWNRSPASATGFNGDHHRGPFMIETIGNFDVGVEVLEGEQLRAVLTVIASIQLASGLAADALAFHNEMTDTKSCPGTGIDKGEMLARLGLVHNELKGATNQAGGGDLGAVFQTFMATDYGALKEGPLPHGAAGT